MSDTGIPTALSRLIEYANGLGVSAALEHVEADPDDPDEGSENLSFVRLQLPNGRDFRSVEIDEDDDLDALMRAPLDKIVILGAYDAIVDRSTGVIEAFVGRPVGGRIQFAPVAGYRIPGAEAGTEGGKLQPWDGTSRPEWWRLRFSSGDRVIELSPATAVARALVVGSSFSSRYATLKLKGFRTEHHDEALADLEEASRSTFFDLDVMYNFGLTLRRASPRGRQAGLERSTHAMSFPKNAYPKSAVELYNYGREAVPFPLLQFLAYYQVLEYFFPAYSRAETTRAIKNAIRHPTFNVDSDADVSRLISLAAPAVQAGIGERQQLAATIRGVVQASEVVAEIERIERVSGTNNFTSKRQAIRGLEPLSLSPSAVLAQLADRIYDLRCRVVHTKSDGEGADELLLPNSPEASELKRELPLLKFLVQKAIVAGAVPFN